MSLSERLSPKEGPARGPKEYISGSQLGRLLLIAILVLLSAPGSGGGMVGLWGLRKAF